MFPVWGLKTCSRRPSTQSLPRPEHQDEASETKPGSSAAAPTHKHLKQQRELLNQHYWETFPLESQWVRRRNASSLLPAGVLLSGARPGFPQQRRAEDADDGQVEGDADGERPDGPQEGWRRPVELEPRPPGRHVRDHALHLEVGSHHSADVEQLVAMA